MAGHHIEFRKTALGITKGNTSFEITRSLESFSFHLDSIKSEIVANTLKCSITGWAFSNTTTAPARSIYVASNGKIIAKAKATRRIDVRADQDLTFDHCGFEVSFGLLNSAQMLQTITLIFVDSSTSQVHHLKISNPHRAGQAKLLCSSIDSTVTRPNEPRYEFGLEHSALVDGRLQINGWCFLKSSPDAEIYINFVKSGVVLGEAVLQTIYRPDVSTGFELDNTFSFYGFEYLSSKLNELPLSAQDRSIDMLLACRPNKKELIRIYSE